MGRLSCECPGRSPLRGLRTLYTPPTHLGAYTARLAGDMIQTMAMDIQGRKPSAQDSKSFPIEFWAWRPIHALIVRLCSDLFDKKTLEGMATGGGGGALDQKTSAEMANRFERWMEHHAEGFVLESGIRVTPEGHFLSEEELAKNPTMETVSPYEVSDERLKKWIEFLRCCGGFEVW